MPAPSSFPLRVGNVVFCEDVRPEINNKYSIFGAIGGDLLVQSFPAVIKAAFYIELYGIESGNITFDIQIYLDKNLVAGAEGQMEVRSLRDPAIIAIPSFPIGVEKEGELRIVVKSGRQRRRVLSKRVMLRAAGPGPGA